MLRGGRVLAGTALLLAVGSCDGAGKSGITLRVVNGTCASGACVPVYVAGFPNIQPRTPGGMWRLTLGTVTGYTACLAIPPEASFSITEVGGSTTVIKWTVADSMELLLSTTPPDVTSGPITSEFRPASSPSWTIGFPGEPAVRPAAACSLAMVPGLTSPN